jgi:hypothetical protein
MRLEFFWESVCDWLFLRFGERSGFFFMNLQAIAFELIGDRCFFRFSSEFFSSESDQKF